jgi:hypothetical protein
VAEAAESDARVAWGVLWVLLSGSALLLDLVKG